MKLDVVNGQTMRKIAQIFVAFSEKLNFIALECISLIIINVTFGTIGFIK